MVQKQEAALVLKCDALQQAEEVKMQLQRELDSATTTVEGQHNVLEEHGQMLQQLRRGLQVSNAECNSIHCSVEKGSNVNTWLAEV